jgi:hypothetical protein
MKVGLIARVGRLERLEARAAEEKHLEVQIGYRACSSALSRLRFLRLRLRASADFTRFF